MTGSAIPARLAEIIEEFKTLQGREKLELLLEFAESLPPLPETLKDKRDQMDQVHECMTPVFVFAEKHDNRLVFHFDIPPDAPTVRGYAGLLVEGLRDCSPQQVLAVPGDFFQPMGLASVVSHQRLNGMSAILAHLKRLALTEIEA